MFFRNILQVSYDFIRTFPIKVHKGQRECAFGCKEENILTLTLKLTLIFPPRRGIWIIWDNPVLGTKASVRVSLSMESMSSHSNSHSHSHQCPHFFNFIQPFFSPG